MTAIQTFQNSSFKVQCVCVSGEPWFKGRDVATVLGYADKTQAIRVNVDDDCKKKLVELGGVFDTPLDSNAKNSIFINEVGLYSLILRSERPDAKVFRRWVCS
jgi:anti-repressor protein